MITSESISELTFRQGSLGLLEPGEISLHVPVLDNAIMVGLPPTEAQKQRADFRIIVAKGTTETLTGTKGYIAMNLADDTKFQIQTVRQRLRSERDFTFARPIAQLVITSPDLKNWAVAPDIEVIDPPELHTFLGQLSLYADAKQRAITAKSRQ